MKKIILNWKKITAALAIFTAAILLVLYIFIRVNTYQAMPEATDLLNHETVHQEDNWIRVEPEEYSSSVVLYQGGLVEETSYLPLAFQLSEKGHRVFLPSQPFNLAILNVSAFEDIYETYEDETNWWLVGHSLGGASASIYASSNVGLLEGLVFLASYPSGNSDLSDSNLPVLSITGSEDEILNWDSYNEAKSNLPGETVSITIEGGNHSNFGYYGFQSGDGESRISREEQHAQLASLINDFIKNNTTVE